MSEFGKVLDENSNKSKVSYGSDFIKINSEHSSVVRVMDASPETSVSHYVPKGHHAFPTANAGKGMSFMCPGKDCPICAWNKEQRSKNPTTKDVLNGRRVYTFNVLDRTPVVVCPSCGAEYYESGNSYPSECECGKDLSNTLPAPRNKIQIMQKGKKIIDQFKSFEQESELGDLREYDIKLDTRGQKTETVTTCIPRAKTKIDMKAVVGADWKDKLYDCKQAVAPLSVDAIKKILEGDDYYSVLKG